MSVRTKRQQYNVLLCDQASRAAVPRSSNFRLLQKPRRASVKNLFVFCSDVQLPQVSSLVTAVNHRNQLRALFVRRDADPAWLPQMLERANLRALRNLVVHSDIDVPRRILQAWAHNAEAKLIAKAMVTNGRLFLISCEPETLEVRFADTPALRNVPEDEQENFELSEDGSYIHWPSVDVHLDLDAVRSALDPEFRDRHTARRVMHDYKYGAAIAALRKENGLRQRDIAGLSERHLRRIEKGERATVTALKQLAKAHDLSVTDYLNVIAERGELA